MASATVRWSEKAYPVDSRNDRQPQAEAKNAFKNLKVRNFRT
ncbi:hypothetical protein [Nostoc favosum]|nr:hypothetical protein [Nostoc favosum]